MSGKRRKSSRISQKSTQTSSSKGAAQSTKEKASSRLVQSQPQGGGKIPLTASLRRKRVLEFEEGKKKVAGEECEEPRKNTSNEEEKNNSNEEEKNTSNEDDSNEDDSNEDGLSNEDASSEDGSKEDVSNEDSCNDEPSLNNSENEDTEIPTKLPPSIPTTSTNLACSVLVDNSLLKSFDTHVAYSIWLMREEKGLLKCISHGRKLKEWNLDSMPAQVIEKVKNSGLYSLVNYSYKNVDYVSISALVERWHPETNSFHMPVGELTITLDDVAQILKMSVVGNCIYKENDDRSVVDLLVQYLGVDEKVAKEETKDSNSVKLNFLVDTFVEMAKKVDATENDYDIVTRAYLLYLFGCSIFCDKSGTKVSVNYLRCLENINQLNEQAWGMGILAYLYRQLGLASRRGVKQMAGCLTLLMAWIYDHFPMLPNAVPSKDYNNTLPRMCKWQPMQQSGDKTSAIIRLREQLDDLNAHDICWDPYQHVRSEFPLPEVAYYNGIILCFDIAEPYYPNRVLRQFGIAQRIPKNPMRPKKCVRGAYANQYRVAYDTAYWYSENWEDHLLSSKLRLSKVIDPWDCTTKYMTWYLKLSHPIVQNPKVRKSSIKKVNTSEKLEMAVIKVIGMLKENLSGKSDLETSDLLITERAAVDILEEAMNEPEKRERRTKEKNDPRT